MGNKKFIKKDTINVPVWAIGCGQGGTNLITAGVNVGLFEQIASINTTTADLMELPESNQILCLNPDNPKRGAGKDARKGARLFLDNYPVVQERMRMIFGKQELSQDAFFVLAGSLGGGSGTGIINYLASYLKDKMDPDFPQPLLGVMTLPEDSFLDRRAAGNALVAIDSLTKNRIYDSLFFVDNNKVYSAVKQGKPLSKVNEMVWKPFEHVFTYVGKASTDTMDISDFENLMMLGRCSAIYETVVPGNVDSVDAMREYVLRSWSPENNFYPDELSNPHRLMQTKNYNYGLGLIVACSSKAFNKKQALFVGLKDEVNGLLSRPDYSYNAFVVDDSLNDEIRVITICTGLPYPSESILKIKDVAESRINQIVDDTPDFLAGIDIAKTFNQNSNTLQRNQSSSLGFLEMMEQKDQVSATREDTPLNPLDTLFGQSTPKKRKGTKF